MKVKTSLVLLVVAIAACATAILWRKPASAPMAVTVSKPAASDVPASTPSPKQPIDKPVQYHQPGPDSLLASSLTAEEILAELTLEIRQSFDSTNLEAREFALTNLLPALVLKDAPAAGRLAESITDTDLREAVMRRVAQLWTAQDPSGALAWAAALTEPGERDATLSDVCLQVAQTDPAEAVRMREQYVPDNVPNLALEGLVQQWAEINLSAALAWTLARPQSGQRDGLIAHLAFVESQTAPAEAVDLVVDQMSPGQAQNEAAMSVLHQWALRDFAAASAWVEQYPEGPLRERAVLELAGISNALHQTNKP